MAEQIADSWRECAREGCIGVQLAASRMCLAHASHEERDSALRAIKESGVVDARGVPLTEALLMRVLAAAPRQPPLEPGPGHSERAMGGSPGHVVCRVRL